MQYSAKVDLCCQKLGCRSASTFQSHFSACLKLSSATGSGSVGRAIFLCCLIFVQCFPYSFFRAVLFH